MVEITGDSPQEEQPFVYENIYDAPAALRVYRSARLSLQQINDLIADAYDHRLPPEEGVRETAIPDFGNAKKRFEETHKIESGFWVEMSPEELAKGDN